MRDAYDLHGGSAPGRTFVGQAMRCLIPVKLGDGAAAVLQVNSIRSNAEVTSATLRTQVDCQ